MIIFCDSKDKDSFFHSKYFCYFSKKSDVFFMFLPQIFRSYDLRDNSDFGAA